MQKSAYENRVWTIPNVLTAFRILMVPVFVWLYCGLERHVLAAAARLRGSRALRRLASVKEDL